MAATSFSTPINTLSRENLSVLIRNNTLDNSVEFIAEADLMETDSPIRKPNVRPISKKLFHSPLSESDPSINEISFTRDAGERSRKIKKRKRLLIPDSSEKIKKAYVKECDGEGYSPEVFAGMRKRVLISLFHNKEYCMDLTG